jgi:hypothetical protein
MEDPRRSARFFARVPVSHIATEDCSEPVEPRTLLEHHRTTGEKVMLPVRTIPDARRQPRFKIEVDISINSRKCGVLKGHTVDISESGIAAMLRIEASLGEVVELDFALPGGAVTIQAIGRQRNAFRYGFEFVDSDSVHELIRRTCRDLAVDQSVTWPDLP